MQFFGSAADGEFWSSGRAVDGVAWWLVASECAFFIRYDGSATRKVLFYITNGKHKEENC